MLGQQALEPIGELGAPGRIRRPAQLARGAGNRQGRLAAVDDDLGDG
ncbi:MAG: hypothetical protein ACYS5V_03180 [Planctomycetota bacterium]|jgi:hypothetical protein